MTKQLIKALQNFDKTSSEIALVDQRPISGRCSDLYKMHELAKEGLSYEYFLLDLDYSFWGTYQSTCPPCPVSPIERFQNENSKKCTFKCPFYTLSTCTGK